MRNDLHERVTKFLHLWHETGREYFERAINTCHMTLNSLKLRVREQNT